MPLPAIYKDNRPQPALSQEALALNTQFGKPNG